jgi:hypothetical protein
MRLTFCQFVAGIVTVAALVTGSQRSAGQVTPPGPPCIEEPLNRALIRTFKLPHPLYCADSVWRQRVDAVPKKQPQDEYVRRTYETLVKTLDADGKPQNFMALGFDDYTVPVFAADPARTDELCIQTYDGESWAPSTLPSELRDGAYHVPEVPLPAGVIRPSCPYGLDSDGHLVLYDAEHGLEYDYWNATTAVDGKATLGGGREGKRVLFAGSVERFDVKGFGAQQLGDQCRPLTSSRATGVPLLAGLLVPEDLAAGAKSEIGHAMVFAMPELRHLCPSENGAGDVPFDFVYPATKTESSHPLEDRFALAAGERIRLKPAAEGLRDVHGHLIDESKLARITQIYLDALRNHGAYLVDGSGAFSFYAEDWRTANLDLPKPDFNLLRGAPTDAELSTDSTQWRELMVTLRKDLYKIPFAVEVDVTLHANFEVIEDAPPPPGFGPGACTAEQLNNCPDPSP